MKTEDAEACEKARVEQDEIVRFAKVLLSLVKENEKKNWFENLGINYDSHIKNSVSFPRWQQAFLSLVYRELIKDNDFIEFKGEARGTPTYEILEYKRGKSDSLPIEGYSWATINGKNIILEIDYRDFTCYINAYHNKEDQEIVKEFLKKLKEKIDTLEYLKGEKLLVMRGRTIKFFGFKQTTRKELVLPQKIWNSLNKNLLLFLNHKNKIEEKGLEWKRGILIWGPPGTGKTLLGKFFCTSLNEITILWVTPKCINDSSHVEKLFEIGRVLAPTIIFIEDLDFFAASRDSHGLHPVLGELLTQLDGITANDGIFVVGTTNNQSILDQAISSRPSRFDVRLEFGLPEQKEREKLFSLFLKENKEINYSLLANRSEGFSAAHIKEACVRGVLSTICKKTDLENAILTGIIEIQEEELNRPPPTTQIS